MDLTILMPCLDEEKTVGACIEMAMTYLRNMERDGEILIIDNGSRDHSVSIARALGARVISCPEKGYGHALRLGLMHAMGDVIILGDSDLSYNFSEIDQMYRMLCTDYDMVIGNRFAVTPVREAMSISHRIGVPVLSFLGRLRYGCKIQDFHCGLRGVRKELLPGMNFSAEGMEFATEFIAEGCRAGLRMGQTPVTLYPDGREGRSHLRTIRDGFRHLRYMIQNP